MNPKVHYHTHKRPPPASILGQPNPVHIPTSHLLEIHRNIIHPSTPRSPQWSLSLLFPYQDPIHPLSSAKRATCPVHLILLDFITRTILGEEYKSFSSSLCNLLHSPVTSSLLDTNILLNTMFSNTLSFLSSRNVSDQISHPYKTTGKIIVLIRTCQASRNINFFFDVTFSQYNAPHSPGTAYFLPCRSMHILFLCITVLKCESRMYFYPLVSPVRHIQSHMVNGWETNGVFW